jgi:type I restriction enzyme M protein
MGKLASGSRKQKEFSDFEIAKIADTYHAWRGEASADMYIDEEGFCASADMDEIRRHNFIMTPGRYVGAGAVQGDVEPFEEKFDRLVGVLREQFAEGRRLEAAIETKLGEVFDAF